mmetsp:Transcript_26517/g.67881  ORF Transcript_26517/g.67881 Transcript_26517/m.67881 type:complete len:227 (+) Transcript_26517:1917-2597(+)
MFPLVVGRRRVGPRYLNPPPLFMSFRTWKNSFYVTAVTCALIGLVHLGLLGYNLSMLHQNPGLLRYQSTLDYVGWDFSLFVVAFGYTCLFALIWVRKCSLVSMQRRRAHWTMLQVFGMTLLGLLIGNTVAKHLQFKELQRFTETSWFQHEVQGCVMVDLFFLVSLVSSLMCTCDCSCVHAFTEFVAFRFAEEREFFREEEGSRHGTQADPGMTWILPSQISPSTTV